MRFKNNSKISTIFKRCKAFTLAEVIIVVGIIGIIAELTIPTLIRKNEETTTVTRLKKVYAALSNAYNLAQQEDGNVMDWAPWNDDPAGSDLIIQKFLKYLNVQKNCGVSPVGCFYNGKYKQLNGTIVDADDYLYLAYGDSGALLADGTSIKFDTYSPSSSASPGRIGAFIVDINGAQMPNQFGRDTFLFWLAQYKIIPVGAQSDAFMDFSGACNKDLGGYGHGRGCAAWVIYNENMDYLHCSDLSWTGKTTCD